MALTNGSSSSSSNDDDDEWKIPFDESLLYRRRAIEDIQKLWNEASSSSYSPSSPLAARMRSLYGNEIHNLEKNRNKCQDWSKLRIYVSVVNPFFREPDEEERRSLLKQNYSRWLQEHVSFNTFDGVVVIGIECASRNSMPDELPPPQQQRRSDVLLMEEGIHHNLIISNSVIFPNTRVYRNACIQNTCIRPYSSLIQNGQVTCKSPFHPGQLQLTIGPETGGGLNVQVMAESTLLEITPQIMESGARPQSTDTPGDFHFNHVGENCIVRDTPTVDSIFLHDGSSIIAACSVEKATLLSNACIEKHCCVESVLLQWHATITTNSSVNSCLTMEHSQIGPHSTVAESILATDVHVSCGEVHSSLLGPNTNAHHQSLCIAAIWPLGRGNIGYGANVGSNHTGRIPDQECSIGEGIFWGLTACIKFPLDTTCAPYTIVAANTTMIPQRIALPFSLIVELDNDGCQILPGWLLSKSPFTITRSERKYKDRRKAKRHGFYTGWKIVRPHTVDLCCAGRKFLEEYDGSASKYNKQIVGKCVLTDASRKEGIEAYTDCIQRYALKGLLEQLLAAKRNGTGVKARHSILKDLHQAAAKAASTAEAETPTEGEETEASALTLGPQSLPVYKLEEVKWPTPLPWDESQDGVWSHQKSVLVEEFSSELLKSAEEIPSLLLPKLVRLEEEYAQRVYESKRRDDVRGERIIPGYQGAHVAAEDDKVVIACRDEAAAIKNLVEVTLNGGKPKSHKYYWI